jgi:uncharacterized protein (DUF697 family)
MATLDKITSVWKNVQEVDLRPIRVAAEIQTRVVLIGAAGSGRNALADQLIHDPDHPQVQFPAPLHVESLDSAERSLGADLFILVLPGDQTEVTQEQALVKDWIASGMRVLIFYNTIEEGPIDTQGSWLNWGTAQVLRGSVDDREFLQSTFASVVMRLLPDRHLSLGRSFPLLRTPIAEFLINETCFSNAVYSFSTGLAEIVPVLDIPLNIADFFVLTKAQALLVYRLGLLLGLPTDWRYYVGEFGGVVGSGYLWRQAARQLVGLIPVWGIIPKVGVAYAGTYVVGQAVLRWHRTGRHVTRKELGALYRQAFARGKEVARGLGARIPRPRLPRRKAKALPEPAILQMCPTCGAGNEMDANFCKSCATHFEV